MNKEKLKHLIRVGVNNLKGESRIDFLMSISLRYSNDNESNFMENELIKKGRVDLVHESFKQLESFENILKKFESTYLQNDNKVKSDKK